MEQEVSLPDFKVQSPKSLVDQDGGSVYKQTMLSDEDLQAHVQSNFTLTLKQVNHEDSNGGDCQLPTQINFNNY